MSVPISPSVLVTAAIDGTPARLFFDRRAALVYSIQPSSSTPAEGTATDFHPGWGRFQIDTFRVRIQLGEQDHDLRCGRLPPFLKQRSSGLAPTGLSGANC